MTLNAVLKKISDNTVNHFLPMNMAELDPQRPHFLFLFFKFHFFYFWLCWVFVATPKIALVTLSGGYPQVVAPRPLTVVASLIEHRL